MLSAITNAMSQPTGAGDPLSSYSLAEQEGADRVIYRLAAAGSGRSMGKKAAASVV